MKKLLIFSLLLISCGKPDINTVYSVDSTLLLFLDHEMIQIDLEDEVDVYYFNTEGKEYSFKLIRGGSSYGKKIKEDYIFYKDSLIPVINDSGDSTNIQ